MANLVANKTRSNSIEALRFIFMLIICFWHNYGSSGIFTHGYLAVEFFFILSGWLLYNSFCKEKPLSVIDYTWKKFKRFAPEYLIVLVYIYLRHAILPALIGTRVWDVSFLIRMLPEALMLQDCGFYLGGANPPLWYLCILLVGGGLIYSILRYNRQLAIKVLLPFLCLWGYTYIFGKSATGSIEVWGVENGIKATLVRGMADMSLGVLLSYVFNVKGQYIRQKLTFINLSSLIGLALVMFIIMGTPYFDRYILIAIPPLLLACFTEKSLINSLFQSRKWVVLGGGTYEMLLLHFRVVMPIHESLMALFAVPIWLNYLIYGMLLVLMSYLFIGIGA